MLLAAGAVLGFGVPSAVLAVSGSLDSRPVSLAARGGIGYLEANGLSVAVTGPDGRGRAQTHGLIGAGYLHATNRNAEPQLHVHVVVTKIVERPDESLASLDASGMFGHAKTAGCLAAADLRHRLTSELGVEWAQVRNGVSEMVGWDRSVLRRWPR